MSVLTHTEIAELAAEIDLITAFDPKSLEGASYDMRLGSQYIRHGQTETLSVEHPTLKIIPGEFAVLSSLEGLNMPNDLVGHNGIMSPWAKRGLVSLFSPQIDPGFRGFLIVPVFNAGDSPISINYRERIFTIEFVRTSKPALYGWSDEHGEQLSMHVPSTPSHSYANMLDVPKLHNEIETLHNQIKAFRDGQVAMQADIKVIQGQLSTQEGHQTRILNQWVLYVGIFALGVAIATLGITFLGSDWLRNSAFGTAATHAATTPPQPQIK
jgi:deoxycytidine triphosphate deaminase